MSETTRIRDNYFFFDVSVDDDLAGPLYKGHVDICGLRFDSGFDGTGVTFLESATETGTYNPVWWEGALWTLVVAASKTVMFDPAKLSGLKWLKLTSSAHEGADVNVYPIYRSFN